MTKFLPLLLCLCTVALHAENRHYDVSSGLPENTVRTIVQDKAGYLWLGTKDGLCRYDGRQFTTYGGSTDPDPRPLNIEQLVLHPNGRDIYICARSGFFLFEPQHNRFTEFLNAQRQRFARASSMCFDKEGNLWLSCRTHIYVQNTQTQAWSSDLTQRWADYARDYLHGAKVNKVFCDSRGIIWLLTHRGLVRYQKAEGDFCRLEGTEDSFQAIAEDAQGDLYVGTMYRGIARVDLPEGRVQYCSPRHERILELAPRPDGKLYVCSEEGFYLFDPQTGSLLPNDVGRPLPMESYYSFFCDREGGYWMGTYFSGVYYISPKAHAMQHFALGDPCAVSQICEAPKGRLFVATEQQGLLLFDPRSQQLTPTSYPIPARNLHALCPVGDRLYVGSFGAGLFCVDLRSGRVQNFTDSTTPALSDNHVYALYSLSPDTLLIGTLNGACRYHLPSGTMEEIPELKGLFVYDIARDSYGRLWFAVNNAGMISYQPRTGQWNKYTSVNSSLSSNSVIRIYIDKTHKLWVCTEGEGVCQFDYNLDDFIPLAYDLPNKFIYGILEDTSGNFWFSSNAGLICYNPQLKTSRTYSHQDGTQSKQFNFRSSYRAPDGKLYFGGIKGFNAFYPHQLHENKIPPGIHARISYTDKDQQVRFISGRRLSLPRPLNRFQLQFDCISFVSPLSNAIRYKFGDNAWTTSSGMDITFLDVRPGRYPLLAKAVNGDGIESETLQMEIRVFPPLYRSLTAKLLYLALALLCLFLIYKVAQKQRSAREQAKRKADQFKREQKLYEAKMQFFTQIAHEIKTPVSLIKAPLQIIMENGPWDEQTARNLELIGHNTEILNRLIKQLLDFRKINQEGYQLTLSEVDVRLVAEDTINLFRGSHKQIVFRCDLPPCLCLLDSDAFVKILTNLISNALRFCQSTIWVDLALQDRTLCLRVKDDGPGIAPAEAHKVFDAFYQAQGGSGAMGNIGLGLSLVKLLAQKHNGDAYVDYDAAAQCALCVDLQTRVRPLQSEDGEGLGLEGEQSKEAQEENKAQEGNKVHLLFVEDNLQLQDFLCTHFARQYSVRGCANGQEALQLLNEGTYDLVVSDIAMPVQDGFALLHHIRNAPLLCHIPVVLLTAEASIESKIKGLEKGAEAYIEKPFDVTHLRAVIENILNGRKRLQERFSREPFEQHCSQEMHVCDREWLQKIDKIIIAHMADPDFGIERIVNACHMSRPTFQRKLKGLVNMTANDYVKLIRLKKAAEFLASGQYRINEVSYLVGFSNPSYFASCFQSQFGKLPSAFAPKKQPPKEED